MIYILMPAHNNKTEVLELLQCLQGQTLRDFEIVFVDDGSTDGTAQEVLNVFPRTVILTGDGTLWWTGANVLGVNHILKKAKDDDFVLLLNNDLLVDHDYLSLLLNVAQSHPRSLIGSTLVDHDNRSFMESGVRFTPDLQLIVTRDRNLIDTTELDLDVDALPGRGTLVPVSAFRTAGNFDSRRLPHYCADYEFSVRARRAGYRLLVSHRARVYAKLNITGFSTSSEKKFITLKECWQLLFSKKSKTNIFYFNNFVWSCSEPDHRLRNVLRSTLSTIRQTVLKTIPAYPVLLAVRTIQLVLRIFLKGCLILFNFLFRPYSLLQADVDRSGLDAAWLVKEGVLNLRQWRGTFFYGFFLNHSDPPMNADQKYQLQCLRRQSRSFSHKIAIIKIKINLLLSTRTSA